MKEWFFLLAGGYGKRARPLTLKTPKPALPLGGVPIINLMLNQLQDRGLTQGFVNTHHLPGQINEAITAHCTNFPGSDIHILHEDKLSGSKIIKEAAPHMTADDLLLVVNGDIFLELPYSSMRQELLDHNADGALLVRPKTGTDDQSYRSLIVDNGYFKDRAPLIPENSSDRRGEHLEPDRTEQDYMYLGVALMRRTIVEKIDHINFFDSLAGQDFSVRVYPYSGIWLDIGTIQAYEKAKHAYNTYMCRS